MFLALGVGAFTAGMFHLLTHAFFKSLMFLAAGSVMHALSNEQDMRYMGGLKKHTPKTYVVFLVGALAISGIPGLSGFFSKDEILWQAYSSSAGNIWFWIVGVIVAGLTAFYIFRLLFLTFHGEPRWKEGNKAHESPNVMTLPLIILALLSVVGGYLGIPAILGGGNKFHHFLQENVAQIPVASMTHTHNEEYTIMAISTAIALAGIFIAYLFYLRRKDLPDTLAIKAKSIYSLLMNKYYVDEIYDLLFVRSTKRLAIALWEKFDVAVIDGIVNGTGKVIIVFGSYLRLTQSGLVQSYAFSIFIGGLLIIGYFIFG